MLWLLACTVVVVVALSIWLMRVHGPYRSGCHHRCGHANNCTCLSCRDIAGSTWSALA